MAPFYWNLAAWFTPIGEVRNYRKSIPMKSNGLYQKSPPFFIGKSGSGSMINQVRKRKTIPSVEYRFVAITNHFHFYIWRIQ